MKTWDQFIGKTPPIYDIRVFELLPLHIKPAIIEKCVVLFGDPLEISEYFYFYRKLWKDMKCRYEHNQYENYKEKLAALEHAKNTFSSP
ncbi:MAG: hypothetical protein ACFFCD_05475 [Promethearchaeota archaeon]